MTPADHIEKLDRRIQSFGSENAFPAHLFCSLPQTLECAADRREFALAVTVSKRISEGICRLAKFHFQLVKLGMDKCVQLGRQFDSTPREGCQLRRETRECADQQFELALLFRGKTKQRNPFRDLHR